MTENIKKNMKDELVTDFAKIKSIASEILNILQSEIQTVKESDEKITVEYMKKAVFVLIRVNNILVQINEMVADESTFGCMETLMAEDIAILKRFDKERIFKDDY